MPYSALKHDEKYYRSRKPKPDLGTVENFKKFVWDPERRAFLDKTRREWGDFGLFYLFFYGVLFTISFVQLWLTVRYVSSQNKPPIVIEQFKSEILANPISTLFRTSSTDLPGPGIAIRPNILSNDGMPLILLDETKEKGHPEVYVEEITSNLREYQNSDRTKYELNCNDRVLKEENIDKACWFNVESLGVCSKAPYGYTSRNAQPCVYIKFNKRMSWLPIFYSQASKLPSGMPDWLQKYIRDSDKFHVWLSCEGQSKEDQDNVGVIDYLPSPGFPVQYFPYAGQKNYHAPMVALQFKNITINKRVTIVCKPWARNIDQNRLYHMEFRILVTNHTIERSP